MYKIGSIYNSPIFLTKSFFGFWLITFFWIQLSIDVPYYYDFVVVLLFSASTLLHELGHGWAIKKSGASVKRIVLNLMGGFIEFESEKRISHSDRIFITSCGPLANFVLSIFFIYAYCYFEVVEFLLEGSFFHAQASCLFLCLVNLALVILNLTVAPPLDGWNIFINLVAKYSDNKIFASRARFLYFTISFSYFFLGIFLFLIKNQYTTTTGIFFIIVANYNIFFARRYLDEATQTISYHFQ